MEYKKVGNEPTSAIILGDQSKTIAMIFSSSYLNNYASLVLEDEENNTVTRYFPINNDIAASLKFDRGNKKLIVSKLDIDKTNLNYENDVPVEIRNNREFKLISMYLSLYNCICMIDQYDTLEIDESVWSQVDIPKFIKLLNRKKKVVIENKLLGHPSASDYLKGIEDFLKLIPEEK